MRPASAEALTPAQVLALLEETPARIRTITARLTPGQLQAAPGPDEWSANDVLAHLRACADVWGGYIGRILEEDTPTIRVMSPRAWIRKTDYRDRPFGASLMEFEIQRGELLALLEPLSPKAWRRRATVKGTTRPVAGTVQYFAERLAVHERHHLDQFSRIALAVSDA